MTQSLNVGSGEIARDPACACLCHAERRAIARLARRWRDFSVQCHSGLQRDQRRMVADVFGKRLVQSFGFVLKQPGGNCNSSLLKLGKTLAANQGIGVFHARDHSGDTGSNQSVRARPCSALVRAGFKIDIQRCPSGFPPACSMARISACLTPSYVWKPSPTTVPAESTTTAPTQGLGEVKPIPWRAKSSARRRKSSSVSREIVTRNHYFTTETQRHRETRSCRSKSGGWRLARTLRVQGASEQVFAGEILEMHRVIRGRGRPRHT